MQIFVINLDRERERLAHMTAMLGQRDLPFERIAAVDRTSLPGAYVRSVNAGKTQVPMDAGSIACFLSHRIAWKRHVESGAQHACILEDDVLFGEKAGCFLTGDGWIPRQSAGAIIRLETMSMRTCWDREVAFQAFGHAFHHLRCLQWGSAAYIIDRDTASRLLARSRRIAMEVDSFLFRAAGNGAMPHGPVLQAYPAPFLQEGRIPEGAGRFPSDIIIARKRRRTGLGRFSARQIASVRKRVSRAGRLALDPLRGERSGIIPFR